MVALATGVPATPVIGARAETLIINEETGGQVFYERTEVHPDWPGGASGVTIGDGYDCGYSDAATIRRDWGPHLPAAMVEQLASVAGIHGSPAQSHARELHAVTVPWDAALAVFRNIDMPKWAADTGHRLRNCTKLPADCFGVLVSIAFNRGSAWGAPGDRYAEMRAIATAHGRSVPRHA